MALENCADADAYDNLGKDVLRFIDEVVTSNKFSDHLFEHLKGQLTPATLVELHLAVGFYIMTTNLLVTFGVDLQS